MRTAIKGNFKTVDEILLEIKDEKENLDFKIKRLAKFLNSTDKDGISNVQMALLREQYLTMVKYCSILEQRARDIEYFQDYQDY